jgi:hydroxymethylpyrimidine pyrophosphatase-like HAD family hydrolase
MSDVHLISLDFDGTIMVYDEPPGFFHPEVIDALNALEARGVAWCTNSGRDRADQERVLAACYARGLRHRPVALLCSESVIFEQQGSAYHPAEPWNSNVHARLVTLQRQVQALLEPELEGMHRRHRGFVTYLGEHFTAFFVPDNDDAAARLHDELLERLAGVDECMLTRNGGWVAILTEGLGKGNTLAEYGRRRGLAADHILAVGDHFNDLNMLNGQAARHVGCPVNAIGAVKETVRQAGGHIATREGPLGTLDVMRRYVAGL